MIKFYCSCGNEVFFENSRCLRCHSEVGYNPEARDFETIGSNGSSRRCQNGIDYQVCNWLVPASDRGNLCLACRLNQIVPNLSLAGNIQLWAKMEKAKRRALSTLLVEGLPFTAIQGQNQPSLIFRFLLPNSQTRVITGHENGVITLNLQEADDAIREHNRNQLQEPYRTLLGHFRHELGHYYWNRWFENDPSREEVLPAFRELFGDERQNYSSALNRYYQYGPGPNWQANYISAYATMHPWEDWAETWAQYLHIMDALETFHAFGLQPRKNKADADIFARESAVLPVPFAKKKPDELLEELHRWAHLSPAINELASNLGHNQLAPFVLSIPVVRKLHFIHCMIRRQRDVMNGRNTSAWSSGFEARDAERKVSLSPKHASSYSPSREVTLTDNVFLGEGRHTHSSEDKASQLHIVTRSSEHVQRTTDFDEAADFERLAVNNCGPI